MRGMMGGRAGKEVEFAPFDARNQVCASSVSYIRSSDDVEKEPAVIDDS
jgi:hypothetical protein